MANKYRPSLKGEAILMAIRFRGPIHEAVIAVMAWLETSKVPLYVEKTTLKTELFYLRSLTSPA